MASKKKLLTSVAAVATAAAIVLGGTFAWQSINQTALNEASDVVNPGGRLHNDMWYETIATTNSDIYVENFAEDEIFARVKLSEYMEIVMNQGVEGAEVTETVAGAKIAKGEPGETDKSGKNLYDYTYATHYFGLTDEEKAAGTTENIGGEEISNKAYEYWDWANGEETERPYFMPTFNKNKDSLAPDLNGLYRDRVGGISNREAAQYVDENGSTVDAGYDVNSPAETKWAIYDGDTNNADEIGTDPLVLAGIIDSGAGADEDAVKLVEETHEVMQVGISNGLISMADWLALNNGTYSEETHADYWVYDEDGWVYWSAPIPAGEATGLLLDSFTLNQVMDDTWYYAIEVTGQFVTANDMGSAEGQDGFYAPDNNGVVSAPSDDALKLLEEIGINDSDNAAASEWYDAIEEMAAGTTETVSIDGVEWFVLAKDGGKALLQAAEPTEQLTGFALDDAHYEADNIYRVSVDHYLNETEYDEIEVYLDTDWENGGYTSKMVTPLHTVLSDMWDYVEQHTYHVVDLSNSSFLDGKTAVTYLMLDRYSAVPTAYDFAGIDPQVTTQTLDATKDHTYSGQSLITTEMMEKMIAASTTGKILTRTHDMPYDTAYSPACYDFVTIESDGAGGFTAGSISYHGVETDIYPMLWVNYEQAIADNPASGGETGGEGEGYLEPTDTLPVINIIWNETTGNTASATVCRGEIYDFAGFRYVGMDATVHNDTLDLSGETEEARSYVGFDEGNNPLLVIEADEPNDTLILTGSANMDETFDFTITITVLDSESGGVEADYEVTLKHSEADEMPTLTVNSGDSIKLNVVDENGEAVTDYMFGLTDGSDHEQSDYYTYTHDEENNIIVIKNVTNENVTVFANAVVEGETEEDNTYYLAQIIVLPESTGEIALPTLVLTEDSGNSLSVMSGSSVKVTNADGTIPSVVYVNSKEWNESSDWSYDSTTGTLTLNGVVGGLITNEADEVGWITVLLSMTATLEAEEGTDLTDDGGGNYTLMTDEEVVLTMKAGRITLPDGAEVEPDDERIYYHAEETSDVTYSWDSDVGIYTVYLDGTEVASFYYEAHIDNDALTVKPADTSYTMKIRFEGQTSDGYSAVAYITLTVKPTT